MVTANGSRGDVLHDAIVSNVAYVNYRYQASADAVRNGVEIVHVGDPVGTSLDLVTRRLYRAAQADGPGLWDDLAGASRMLRSRVLTNPQPLELNSPVFEAVEEVLGQVQNLRGAVVDNDLLDCLAEAASALLSSDPAVGQVLTDSIHEVGESNCLVIAASSAARAGIGRWLESEGVLVLTVGEAESLSLRVEQVYVVGPPRFFRSAIVTAPVAGAMSFLLPSWFRDLQIPQSPIAAYADGAIRVKARVFTEGVDGFRSVTDVDDPSSESVDITEAELLPQPRWEAAKHALREPTIDEVRARKILLSGDLAIWLDDGQRIRGLDLHQPRGEQVTYVDMESVQTGTYLLLRLGVSDHDIHRAAAVAALGPRAAEVQETQDRWKSKLRSRLGDFGYTSCVLQLEARGVKHASRVRAWAEPNLIRPINDLDFEKLLEWLGFNVQPAFGNATNLRRAIQRVAAKVREELEAAVSAANLSALEAEGFIMLNTATAGFRGIVVTRVLAISPHWAVVPRREVRVPFDDGSGQWLE